MTTAIQEYSATEAALSELREQYGATVWNVDTPERMAGAKSARAEIRKWRTDLEAERKRIKSPALQRCKEIDTEAKRITAELLILEKPVDDAIKEVEQAKKRAEEEVKRADEERIAKCRTEIDRINTLPIEVIGNTASQLKDAFLALEALDLSWTAEFIGVAETAKVKTLARLREMRNDAEEQEANKARIEAERAELEQLRAAQVAREAKEREQRESEERERRAKLEAEEKASRERIAEDERIAREAREKADAEARKLRAEQEAESRRLREAEEARLREERERLEAERKADDNRKRIEAEKVADEERAKQLQNDMLLDGLELLRVFVERYGHMSQFESIACEIVYFLDEANK